MENDDTIKVLTERIELLEETLKTAMPGERRNELLKELTEAYRNLSDLWKTEQAKYDTIRKASIENERIESTERLEKYKTDAEMKNRKADRVLEYVKSGLKFAGIVIGGTLNLGLYGLATEFEKDDHMTNNLGKAVLDNAKNGLYSLKKML